MSISPQPITTIAVLDSQRRKLALVDGARRRGESGRAAGHGVASKRAQDLQPIEFKCRNFNRSCECAARMTLGASVNCGEHQQSPNRTARDASCSKWHGQQRMPLRVLTVNGNVQRRRYKTRDGRLADQSVLARWHALPSVTAGSRVRARRPGGANPIRDPFDPGPCRREPGCRGPGPATRREPHWHWRLFLDHHAFGWLESLKWRFQHLHTSAPSSEGCSGSPLKHPHGRTSTHQANEVIDARPASELLGVLPPPSCVFCRGHV